MPVRSSHYFTLATLLLVCAPPHASEKTHYPIDSREQQKRVYVWVPEHKEWDMMTSGEQKFFDGKKWVPYAPPAFEKGWYMVETTDRVHLYYVYVFKDGRRVFKSPPMRNYWNVNSGPHFFDLDENGVPDAVWNANRLHFSWDYGTIFSMNGGADNYFLHCDGEGDSFGKPARIEFDRRLPDNMIPLVTKATESWCTPEFQGRLEILEYQDLSDTRAVFPLLRKIHAKALSEYRAALEKYKDNPERRNRAIRAGLDPFIAEILAYRDFRAIDPDNKNHEYTAILNDIGFLYDTAGAHEYATAFLEYVVQRDPNRAVARLNYADALYEYLKTPPEERFTQPSPSEDPKPQYQAYYDLMVQASKRDKIPPRVMERKK